jgi:hypothetical protein
VTRVGLHPIAVEEARLGVLKYLSPEWWSEFDALERSRDERLSRSLVICRGCLPILYNDRSGPTRATGLDPNVGTTAGQDIDAGSFSSKLGNAQVSSKTVN